MKVCTICGCAKHFPDDFFRDNRLKSGHRSACKACDISYLRSSEAKKRGQDNFRKKHGKRVLSAEQKEKSRRYERMKYHTDPEWRQRKSEADQRYRQSPKGRVASLRAKTKRRAKGSRQTLTADEWQKTLEAFEMVCAYCGRRDNITCDHFIPLNLGGSTVIGNIVPACRSCNSSKQDKMPNEWCTPEQLKNILTVLECL